MENGYDTFLTGISLKVNVIERLNFEPAHFEASVRHVNHYATGDPFL